MDASEVVIDEAHGDVLFLSDPWFAAIRDRGARLPELPDVDIRTEFRLSDGPERCKRIHEIVTNGQVSKFGVGALDDPDVVMTMTYDVFRSLIAGDRSPDEIMSQVTMSMVPEAARRVAAHTARTEYTQMQADVRAFTRF